MRSGNKIILLGFLFVMAGIFMWYMLLKNWDYRWYFNVKSSSGVVYQTVTDWNIWNGKTLNENLEITDKEPWESVNTRVQLNDTTLLFYWRFKQLNDSLTRVRVDVSDTHRRFLNRIITPFRKTNFERSVLNNINAFRTRIKFLNGEFEFENVGMDSFKKTQCVYISTKSTRRNKALEMMKNVTLLNRFVNENELGLDGHPFLVLHDHDFKNDTIKFDFCFPILYPEKVPENTTIKTKEVSMRQALKGNFYGNYRISDMSWYLLTEEANRKGVVLNGQIIEMYFNDPHFGGNDLEWLAEIYLGIK
ncbi:MAG: hypothetical protein R3182_08135 [Draconibacterium sp.]|nr:hypothetical protein [Draconibacterium sp.]